MSMTAERETLYAEYAGKVRGYVSGKLSNKADVEDVVSEVFPKVCEKYQTFDADRASAATWVYTITRNTVIDYFRAHRICAELPEDLPDEGGVDDGLLRQESLRTLGEALGKLDDRSRALIVLRYYKRMSLKETAAFYALCAADPLAWIAADIIMGTPVVRNILRKDYRYMNL